MRFGNIRLRLSWYFRVQKCWFEDHIFRPLGWTMVLLPPGLNYGAPPPSRPCFQGLKVELCPMNLGFRNKHCVPSFCADTNFKVAESTSFVSLSYTRFTCNDRAGSFWADFVDHELQSTLDVGVSSYTFITLVMFSVANSTPSVVKSSRRSSVFFWRLYWGGIETKYTHGSHINHVKKEGRRVIFILTPYCPLHLLRIWFCCRSHSSPYIHLLLASLGNNAYLPVRERLSSSRSR